MLRTAQARPFLSNGGGCGTLMRAHDWSRSPLGSPDAWPPALRTVVALILNSKFPMFVAWGPQLGFLYNDSYAEILGGKHPVAMGRRFQEIWPEIWEELYPIIEHAMHGRASYHENLPLQVNRQGYDEPAWFTFSYSPVQDERGQVMGMFCAVTETTKQVLAERAGAEETERLRQLFEQAPGLMAVLRGRNHVFELANRAYQDLVGHRELLGRPVHEALPEVAGQGLFELLDRVFATGEPYVGRAIPVTLQRAPDGSLAERFVDFVFQPIRDSQGLVHGIFVQGSDISDAVKSERALRDSEQQLRQSNRQKDEFLAMLAHELRNPLAPISTSAEILKLAAADEQRVRQAGSVIARQVAHMTELVDDLLDVSRVTRGLVTLRREVLDLNAVIADAVVQAQPLIDSKRQHLGVNVGELRPFVQGDRTRLMQVFSNILHNAAKYTPTEGRIAVAVSADDTHTEISVRDDGIGIAAALLPQIFDLFTQAERSADRSLGGLGIGLTLVKSLVELHGGSVRAHSDGDGHGSTFVVRLPRCAPPADGGAGTSAVAPAAHASNPKRILVVDDNRDAAQSLAMLLGTAGHQVTVAYSAQDALASVHAAAPSIVFLDIGLPEINGYELIRLFRRLPQTARSVFVAVTGYGQPADKARALDAGFDHHMVKPVPPGLVMSLVDGLVAGMPSHEVRQDAGDAPTR